MAAFSRSTSRRRFLARMGGLAAAAAIAPSRVGAVALDLGGEAHPPVESAQTMQTEPASAPAPAPEQSTPPPPPKIANHLAWVWRFSEDGDPWQIRETLAAHGLGVLFKTHNGASWMPDLGGDRDGSPQRVADMARFFEEGGVPFHAWCVPKGTDPIGEAHMAANVLASGARTLTLDLEDGPGFWEASDYEAHIYGKELRRWQPDAYIVTSTDARPWAIDGTPVDWFAAISDAWAPQAYWKIFNSPANHRYYTERYGHLPWGVTPSLVVDAAVDRLSGYGLPIYPIGDGTAHDAGQWSEFIEHSRYRGAPGMSAWRYGITNPAVWGMLQGTPLAPA